MGEGHTSSDGADLLEREHDLAVVAEAIDSACDGTTSAVLIEGPPGIGKTRLLEAAATRAGARGMQVLHARASELGRDAPAGIVRRLLEPALVEGPNAATVGELYRLCAHLAEEGPLMLAVDDLHWADRSSLGWLAHLAGGLDGQPVLMACALRPDEPGTGSRELRALRDAPRLRRVAPAALSPAAVAEIVRTRLDPDAAADLCYACHDASGGNPFLVGELLTALAANGARDAEHVHAIASRGVSAAVLSRVARLPPEAGALTRSVAVLGDDADLESAALLAQLPLQAAADAADALARCDVLTPAPAVGFVHPLVRASVHEALEPAERADLHARAARMLFGLDAAPDTVAAHLLASQPAGDPWAVTFLTRSAARASARGASDTAIAYLRRALAEPPDGDERWAVLLALGSAEALALESQAEANLDEVLEGGEPPRLRGLAALELGRALVLRDRFNDATAAFDHGILALGPGDRELVLRLEAEALTAANQSASRDRGTAARAARLLPEAEAAATPAERLLLGAIAWERALAASMQAAAVARLATRALAGGQMLAAETAESPVFYAAVSALTAADRLADASGHLDEALDDAQRRNSVRAFALASSLRAWAGYRRGALADAEADARAALAVATEHGGGADTPIAFATLADCLLERGAVGEAAAVIDEWWDDERLGRTTMLGTALAVRARVRLLSGDPDGALADFRRCGRRNAAWSIGNPSLGVWRSGSARLLAARGELEEAHAILAEQVEVARAYGAPHSLGIALRDAGIVRDDVALLEEAVATLAASEARLEHARALAVLGRALARAGRVTDARQPLREALDMAHRCGATALAERARSALVAAGGRPRRLVLNGIEALTPSELRMAGLAASGLTNRAIAERQFLTVRAIEAHLSSAYRKLGIRSRDELASALEP